MVNAAGERRPRPGSDDPSDLLRHRTGRGMVCEMGFPARNRELAGRGAARLGPRTCLPGQLAPGQLVMAP